MIYIFVWQMTGERRMPRFGEWYLTETLGCKGPFQYNGRTILGNYEIVVRRPVAKPTVYAENAIIGAGVKL